MRYLTLLFLLFISCLASAQESRKGSVFLSGNSTPSTASILTINSFTDPSGAKAGYFLSDRLLAGANPFDGLVFARYYQPLSTNRRLRAFAEIGVRFVIDRIVTPVYEPAIGLEYELRPGLLASVSFKKSISNQFRDYYQLDFNLDTYTRFGRDIDRSKNFFAKGRILLNPTLGSIRLSNEGLPYTESTLRLGGSYFLSNRFVLGLGLVYSQYEVNNEGTGFQADGTSFTAGLNVRYLLRTKGRLRPYLGTGVRYLYEKGNINYNSPDRENRDNEEDFISPYFQAGLLYQIGRNLALDFDVNYDTRRTSRISGGYVRLNLGLKLGF